MPMRAYRATVGHVGVHVGRNIWKWVGVSAAATVIAGFVYGKLGRSAGVFGDFAALSGCILGTLVMVRSQLGFVPEHPLPGDDVIQQ
ncbi:hypothetical protein JYK14_13725 [Siccirubricoccus sp. KC 17139]|uniref:Uncharacterized protein n=1 Tax=Siccirubricoccus soli TaxID=2899147 RepID=A0ABT1D5K8_9PROT|nr:hypothetical protein [Siccirubricoccus soli]MCO6417215.1 hypothetical protein [Siccirubricoccus soli]MCP2683350.1 hypothetical protein [Siccirubricoccus soli]